MSSRFAPCLAALVGVLLPGVALAQSPYNLRLSPVDLVGSTYTVVVQISTNAAQQIGSGSLRLTFNDAAIRPVSSTASGLLVRDTDFQFRGFSSLGTVPNANYQPGRVVRNVSAGDDGLSIETELNTPNTGVTTTSTFVDLVEIEFTVVDANAPPRLAWQTSSLLLDGTDDTTPLPQGTFTGDDSALPVELTAFTAARDGEGVRLAWTTASETDNAGFGVEHAGPGADFREVAFVPGMGTTAEASSYGTVVPAAAIGRHRFRLRQVDVDGTATVSPTIEVAVEAPRVLSLAQNAPNPVTVRARIAFTVPEDGPATIVLYDLLGRQVARLFDGMATAGQLETITVDAADLAAGVYVYRLTHGTRAVTRTLNVTR